MKETERGMVEKEKDSGSKIDLEGDVRKGVLFERDRDEGKRETVAVNGVGREGE